MNAFDIFSQLPDNKASTWVYKINQLVVLYTKWNYDDKKEPVEDNKLVNCQCQRYKVMGTVIMDLFSIKSKSIPFDTCFINREIYYFWQKPGLAKALSFNSYL